MGVTKVKTDAFAENSAHLSEKNPRLALQLQLESARRESAASLPFVPEEDSVAVVDVLYLFGWEGREDAKPLLKWLHLSPSRKLILISDDLARLAAALSSPCWTPLFKEERVSCFLPDATLHPIIWASLYRRSHFVNLAASGTKWASEGERCRQLLLELKWEAESALAVTSDFGVREFENLCCNLLRTEKVIEAESLWGQFSQIPAVICGAGPSLEKEIQVLKTLEGRALIIAAGSAIHCLEKEGIEPHFGAALDPDLPPERMQRQQSFTVPFFYQQQLSPELFSLLQGEKLATLGSAASLLQRQLLTQLGIAAAPFEAGWNAITFAAHLAYRLGCFPLVFIGMDSCTSDGCTYAAGAACPDEREHWQRIDSIACVDREGRPVWSRPDFLLGKKWLESFAEHHPDCELINASGQGLAFAGLSHRSLEEVATSRLQTEWDLKGRVHHAIAVARRKKVEKKQIIAQIKQVRQSALRCAACCNEILNGYHQRKAVDQGRALVATVELEEELFWHAVLTPLWEIWRHLIQREEIVQNMTEVTVETAIQKMLFWARVCRDYERVFTHLSFEFNRFNLGDFYEKN